MSRFERLTDAEARTLTRRELLDRIEAGQAYWFRKRSRMAEDDAAFREFTRIMHACLPPAAIAGAIADTIDCIEGRSPGSYWDTCLGEETLRLPSVDAGQRAALDYARRAIGTGRQAPGRGELNDRRRRQRKNEGPGCVDGAQRPRAGHPRRYLRSRPGRRAGPSRGRCPGHYDGQPSSP